MEEELRKLNTPIIDSALNKILINKTDLVWMEITNKHFTKKAFFKHQNRHVKTYLL